MQDADVATVAVALGASAVKVELQLCVSGPSQRPEFSDVEVAMKLGNVANTLVAQSVISMRTAGAFDILPSEARKTSTQKTKFRNY